MRAHTIAGEPAAALTAYEQLRTTLADELGTDPAPETQSLHLAILRGDPAAPDPRGSAGAPHPHLPVQGAPTGRVTQPGAERGRLSTAPSRGGEGPPRGDESAAWGGVDPGFVGREGEVAELAGAWEGAVTGRAQLVLVVGRLGSGRPGWSRRWPASPG